MATSLQVDKPDQPELAKHDPSVLDLVFVMDCTGSMGSYIESARENIRSIVEEIVTSEKSDIHLALIEYRDHPPQEYTFVTRVHDFTTKVKEMRAWLDQCEASGGGDAPEAVADALHDVLKLSWRAEATKIAVLISDAPPHGLDLANDGFPEGDPGGIDPLKTVREMAEKQITLYCVGVEPPIVSYRDFFMTIAYLTGGQYVPMINAKLLAQVIIGGVREEISLERLMKDAQEDIDKEMKQAEAEGVDEQEITTRVNRLLLTRNARVKQMNNLGGETSNIAKSTYAKCADMNELRSQFKIETPSMPEIPVRRTRADVRRAYAEGRMTSVEIEAAAVPPPPLPLSSSSSAAREINYDLKDDEVVSLAQTERIVQRMRVRRENK